MQRTLFYLLVLCLTALLQIIANRNGLANPPTVRNHYVVLIDGSGSNVRGQARRTAFYSMLRDTLTQALFEAGFGPEIPSFDSDRDLLSICDFGILDGGKVKRSAARASLRSYSFEDDFIHVRAKRESGWTRKRFAAEVVPRTWYQIQVINWAVPLAMMSLRAEDDHFVDQTLLVVVTDGERYEDDYADEETQAFRYGDADSPQWAIDATRDFKRQYKRSGSVRTKKPAVWSSAIVSKDGKAQVFAALHYLESIRFNQWKSDYWKLSRHLEITSTSTNSGGERLLMADHGSDLRRLLQGADQYWSSLEFTQGADFFKATAGAGSDFEVRIPSSGLTDSRQTLEYDFSFSVCQRDAILGNLVYTKRVQRTLDNSEASFAGSWWPTLLSILMIVGALGLAATLALWAVKWIRDHGPLPISIRPRHYLADIRMVRRQGDAKPNPEPIFSTILPKTGREAFRIITTSQWLQRLILPDSKLKIELEKAHTNESDSVTRYLDVEREFTFPISSEHNLVARWKNQVQSAVAVKVTVLTQDKPISVLRLAFTHGETAAGGSR